MASKTRALKKQPYTITKTVHIRIGTKSLKTCLKWSYQILKISKTTSFHLMACRPDRLLACCETHYVALGI